MSDFTDFDRQAMRLAIDASRAALTAGNNPFGATLVSPNGEILLVSENNQNTAADFTGHAEMVVVREAAARFGPAALRGATVYASGEPCPMCAGAMYWAGISRVVYGATSEDIRDARGSAGLPSSCAYLLRKATPPVRVDPELLREEAAAALRGQ
ncbi:nucleoside deaminase [Xylophilus rhododendri]|uniref:Nucleoside deaminase n=1 Tax=Xylophilus rhododendri TaxID=2697032 RepID=A0A857JBA2_9BURK|nr:nucleoside deaminase [Xylophilus rhododendri]QHJ00253.1 nucleoside deaminase [Xylophilus rhododendri]